MVGRSQGSRTPRRSLSYDQAKELARSDDVAVRAELAGRDDIKPEILYYLAEDPSPEVRAAIARNRAAPHHADLLLAGDSDEEVRGTLASKIASLAQGLSSRETDRVRMMAYQALETLARDQVTRVRRILAEALKDVANAPPEVINRLARDAEVVVSGPVLRYSPVLTEEDLLAIIAERPAPARLEAIAGRINVPADVVDALVDADDELTVAVLLDNTSAQIREQTLDRIIDHAQEHVSWHGPLVRRPQLSEQAALRLAQFVAAEFLDILEARDDLPAETLQAVREEVARRLADDAEGGRTEPEDAHERALALEREHRLTEDVFLSALAADDLRFARAALAVRADFDPEAVQKAIEAHSAKGLVSLCWKAGFSPKTAERVQRKLGLVGPRDILKADGKRYPMTVDEMEWHLEFVAGLAG